MTHSIRCNCGKLKGTLDHNNYVNRCLCYCADYQAFARFLKRENEILDERGGTSIIQTIPENVVFTERKPIHAEQLLAAIPITMG